MRTRSSTYKDRLRTLKRRRQQGNNTVCAALAGALWTGCGPALNGSATGGNQGTQAEETEVEATANANEETGACELPENEEVSGSDAYTFQITNATMDVIYLEQAACGQRVELKSNQGSRSVCAPDCTDETNSPFVPDCDHCASLLVKLPPGASYEEKWSRLLYEAIDVPLECGGASTPVCRRTVWPTEEITATVVASLSLDCDPEFQTCDCEPGEQEWCTIEEDLVGDRKLSGMLTFHPAKESTTAALEIVIDDL